ncbi:hypothetical protein COCOBI_03-2040 [Coccomyxa sp. Obi]|nr:hypothetical protein COCOBI_03-2040 [Coccomyxa sp. Obi]
MMETSGRSLGLEFAPPCYAVQLRITPQLKEALLNAYNGGKYAAMRLDECTGAITIGDQDFTFKANDETCCDLLKLPQNTDEYPAEEVAQIRQKLQIQRTLDDEERRRARERRLMAEEQQNTRTMQRLEKLPVPAKGPQKLKRPATQLAAQNASAAQRKPVPAQPRPAVAPKPPVTTYQRPSTPPVSRGPTPPPPGASGFSSRGPTPPPPSSAGRPLNGTDGSVVRAGTPPVGALGGKPPKSKSNTLLSKLGSRAGPGAGRPTSLPASKTLQQRSKEPPPAAAIEGAKHSVAVCLLGLIYERDFRRLAQVEQALAEVAARVPGFKPPTGQALTDQLKRVAPLKAPGIYTVLPEFHKQAKELKERAAAAAVAGAAAATGVSRGNSSDLEPASRSSSPEVPQTTTIAQQSPRQKNAKPQLQQQGAGKAAGRSQQPTPEPQRKLQPGGAAPRSTVGGALQQSPAEPLLQLVEDDLGIPSMQKSQPSPTQRTAQPAKRTTSPTAAKSKPFGTAPLAGVQQPLQRQTQGPGSRGLAGLQQQSKASSVKVAVAKATQRLLPAADTGKLPAAKPKLQKYKLPSGAPGVQAAPAKQLPAPGPPKAAKRSRTVLEETDNDSEDDWTPSARLTPTPRASPVARPWARGSSEEGGSGSGDRALVGGSNTTSSLPPRSSPSSEDAPDLPQTKRQQLEPTPPITTELPRAPSALASSNCADDSWFAVYEARSPIQHQPVADARQYKDYCEEYSAKFHVYHKLHQEMSTVTRYVKALKEGAQSAPSEAGRQEYGMQAERLYSRTETLMQRWASAFKVLHAELEDLFSKLTDYREAMLRGSLGSQVKLPVSQALAA